MARRRAARAGAGARLRASASQVSARAVQGVRLGESVGRRQREEPPRVLRPSREEPRLGGGRPCGSGRHGAEGLQERRGLLRVPCGDGAGPRGAHVARRRPDGVVERRAVRLVEEVAMALGRVRDRRGGGREREAALVARSRDPREREGPREDGARALPVGRGAREERLAHGALLVRRPRQTRRLAERLAREDFALARRVREERRDGRLLRREARGERDPRPEPGQPERRPVESRGERAGRRAALPERGCRGGEAAAQLREPRRSRGSGGPVRRRAGGGEEREKCEGGVQRGPLSPSSPSASARPSARIRTSSSLKKSCSRRMCSGVLSS